MNLKKIYYFQLIPHILGLSSLYLILNFLKVNNFLLTEWKIPYIHILVFSLIFWISSCDKLIKLYNELTISKHDSAYITKKITRFYLIRMGIINVLSGIAIYKFIEILIDSNYMISISTIFIGIFIGLIILFIELKYIELDIINEFRKSS